MTLFVGGPANGWRIEVQPGVPKIHIPIDPQPPVFTPNATNIDRIAPVYLYKRENITCGAMTYDVFIPNEWSCDDLVEALLINYGKPLPAEQRLEYVANATGAVIQNADPKLATIRTSGKSG